MGSHIVWKNPSDYKGLNELLLSYQEDTATSVYANSKWSDDIVRMRGSV